MEKRQWFGLCVLACQTYAPAGQAGEGAVAFGSKRNIKTYVSGFQCTELAVGLINIRIVQTGGIGKNTVVRKVKRKMVPDAAN